uniref:Putative ovule protein n=1 Tax=Solanum chacoense TaxID=4108 RepID=A0A0V0H893_SOLCH
MHKFDPDHKGTKTTDKLSVLPSKNAFWTICCANTVKSEWSSASYKNSQTFLRLKLSKIPSDATTKNSSFDVKFSQSVTSGVAMIPTLFKVTSPIARVIGK